MLKRFTARLFRSEPKRSVRRTLPQAVLTQACVTAMHDCLLPEMRRDHEGIAYLLGQSDGSTTLVVAAIRPDAVTTRGSFNVSAPAMARVVRKATDYGLQVVGQVHTHPGDAYHSDGDNKGARIAYSGYVSIVIPVYGRHLPKLEGIAAFMFRAGDGFVVLDPTRVLITPARVH